MNIENEIVNALSTPMVRYCCFSSNVAVLALRRHGYKLLAAVENVFRNCALMTSGHEIHSEGDYDLLSMYFDIVHENNHETATFVREMPNRTFQTAVAAIRSHWGTNHNYRFKSISRTLFECLNSRIGDADRLGDLLSTLRRYMTSGMLTFGQNHSGVEHPPRHKYNSTDEMFEHLRTIREQYNRFGPPAKERVEQKS